MTILRLALLLAVVNGGIQTSAAAGGGAVAAEPPSPDDFAGPTLARLGLAGYATALQARLGVATRQQLLAVSAPGCSGAAARLP